MIIHIFYASLILGFLRYRMVTPSGRWEVKFFELWNSFFNFFIAGIIGYYFVFYRWPEIAKGKEIITSDFFLLIIFALGIFGHLCVMSKNITDGIEAILKRVLER